MSGPRTVLVSGRPERGAVAVAAALAVECARLGSPAVVLADAGGAASRRSPTVLASPAARELEAAFREGGLQASARGHLCHLAIEPTLPALAELSELAPRSGAATVVLRVPSLLWRTALEAEHPAPAGGVLLLGPPQHGSLAALAHSEARSLGVPVKVVSGPPGPIAARRALAGINPGGPFGGRMARIASALGASRGQALPAVLGAALLLIGTALALAAIGGAVTGASRAQRAADVAALSAARSMRDDLPRLLAPEVLPDGGRNPGHLARREYLGRARAAAASAARRNGVDPRRLRITFPDRRATPPLRARALVLAEVDPSGLSWGGAGREPQAAEPIEVRAAAVAEATPPGGGWTGISGMASGGGYSGPLVHRNGEGMRPDVGRAFDLMASAARRAGLSLVVNSGFRSDAEQARLFAANPDPTWVAPPGRSLHRCATELDLGPPGAYGWLAANARRFGFVQRYSWEPWHYGFAAGPPPCSAAGERVGSGPDGEAAAAGLPSFVPARFRDTLMRSAARWDVSGAMLAAQLMAESGFDPGAVSPAGAQGIAQFMPATAASYGLRNPFDPVAAIDAQAHMMSDLLRRFRSVPLALAAYNAGPGAVGGCMCIPPYPETRAYVARILALLNGAGVSMAPPLEVRLVR